MAFLIITIITLIFFWNSKTIPETDNPNIYYKSCMTCFDIPLNSEVMNCEICIDNYFSLEDTYSWYNFIQNNFF